MSDVDEPRSGRVKRIAVGSRVSGKFGEYESNSTGGKRRRRARIFGTVLQAIDSKRYRVLFDNNRIEACFSNSLKVESISSLPPDLRPPPLPEPPPTTDQQPPVVQDNEDSDGEHLPDHRPEDDESVEPAGEEEELPPQDLPVGALPTAIQVEGTDYRQQKSDAIAKVREQLGKTVREKSGNQSILWTVIDGYVPEDLLEDLPDNKAVGWKEIINLKSTPKNQILARLYLDLMFHDTDDLKSLVRQMNSTIKSTRDSRAKLFSPEEFIVGIGLLIGAAAFHQQGSHCWKEKEDEKADLTTEEEFFSLISHPNFDKYMTYNRFKDFRRFFPTIWIDENEEGKDPNDRDPWYQITLAIKRFNMIRQKKIHKSQWAVIDESMSAWRPRTTRLGGLPHLSHVPRKPEPLGTEFKCTADPASGCMLALEIQQGKEAMKHQTYNSDYGNTCGCTLRLMNITKGDDDVCVGVKGDAWFGSIKSCANLKSKGYESVLQIKQNHALYPKNFVNEILKDAPGGVSIVLKGSLNGITLIATGYRYSRKTILYFVMSERGVDCSW